MLFKIVAVLWFANFDTSTVAGSLLQAERVRERRGGHQLAPADEDERGMTTWWRDVFEDDDGVVTPWMDWDSF